MCFVAIPVITFLGSSAKIEGAESTRGPRVLDLGEPLAHLRAAGNGLVLVYQGRDAWIAVHLA
jgi:hypothetical protein